VILLRLQKAACGPQSREFKAYSRHIVNPRKIATLAPTILDNAGRKPQKRRFQDGG
jgi:hypothetical protein